MPKTCISTSNTDGLFKYLTPANFMHTLTCWRNPLLKILSPFEHYHNYWVSNSVYMSHMLTFLFILDNFVSYANWFSVQTIWTFYAWLRHVFSTSNTDGLFKYLTPAHFVHTLTCWRNPLLTILSPFQQYHNQWVSNCVYTSHMLTFFFRLYPGLTMSLVTTNTRSRVGFYPTILSHAT